MVNLATIAAALSAAASAKSLTANRELQDDFEGHSHDNGTVQASTDGGEVAEKLDRLIDIESKNKPTRGDKDAFSSATVELSPGETVQVTVEPAEGFNLRVKRIHFDRRDEHSYEINVGGDVSSVSHRAKYVSPKLVTQSDRVVASATNNSGSATIVDFEMEAWAERP